MAREELKARTLSLFWNSLYNKFVDSLSRDPKSPANIYHDSVIKLLMDSKSKGALTQSEDLMELQNKIEDLSMNFHVRSKLPPYVLTRWTICLFNP